MWHKISENLRNALELLESGPQAPASLEFAQGIRDLLRKIEIAGQAGFTPTSFIRPRASIPRLKEWTVWEDEEQVYLLARKIGYWRHWDVFQTPDGNILLVDPDGLLKPYRE